jgi:hypothetical protein
MDYHNQLQFDNGYGLSVVCKNHTYGSQQGFFEAAVLDFSQDSRGRITYTTPIAEDVIGWLDFAGVAELIEKVKALPCNRKIAYIMHYDNDGNAVGVKEVSLLAEPESKQS